MLQIVLCEDNLYCLSQTANAIEKILSCNFISGQIVCKATETKTVEDYLKHNTANVFLLDINLDNNGNGFFLAQKIRENNQHAYIVFLTCHLEYVLQAFKVHSFDFLVKPVSKEILEQCILNIYKNYISTLSLPANNGDSYIQIKSGSSLYRIKTKDIIYIEKLKFKTVICMAGSEITCYDTLESLEQKLNDSNFVRCHKSFIANRLYISEIHLKEKEILFETGHKCLLGGKYRKELVISA
ncbi:MAG: LytTR family DNA-binding domain-containing protein [Clostridia bacterium]|nr:LytTR family DNA-binding domain-containing protein [Clostridia bacterium]